MRLSDAIALGRVMLKAAPGHLDDGESGCALGMAFRASGKSASGSYGLEFHDLHGAWPWLTKFTTNPCRCTFWNMAHGGGSFAQAVAHLFDAHVMQDERSKTMGEENEPWTLDQLIDWVRSVEPEETPSLPEAVAIEEAHAEVCEKHLTGAGAGHEL